MRKTSGEFCTTKIGGELNTFSLSSDEKAQKEMQERSCFAITKDSDGEEHLGVKLSKEELSERMKIMRQFYKEGMIPWVCPSCGKLWGANYDVGSLRSFSCHECGAEWELINGDDMDVYTERERRMLHIKVLQ
jgi:hypothetical protein